MTKIVLLFWVLTDGGNITEPQQFDGWLTMHACLTAAESLTEENPKVTNKYAVIAQCVEVPR